MSQPTITDVPLPDLTGLTIDERMTALHYFTAGTRAAWDTAYLKGRTEGHEHGFKTGEQAGLEEAIHTLTRSRS